MTTDQLSTVAGKLGQLESGPLLATFNLISNSVKPSRSPLLICDPHHSEPANVVQEDHCRSPIRSLNEFPSKSFSAEFYTSWIKHPQILS